MTVVRTFDTRRIRGVIPAMVTPMTAGGAPDPAGIRSLVRFLLERGVHGIFALGTSGEFPLLTPRDREEVVRIVVDEVRGRVPVLAGASDSGTRQVFEHVAAVAEGGADVAVVLPPYFLGTTTDEIRRHYEVVLDRSPLPVLLYNNPASAGVSLSFDLVRQLADHELVAGIKDSSGDFAAFRRFIDAFRDHPRFRVVQGHEGHAGLSFYLGAHAGHLGLANVVPGLFVHLYEAARAGDLERTLRLQAESDAISAIWEVAGPEDSSYLGSMKAALHMLGVCGPDLAPPYAVLEPLARERVRTILARHGVLDAAAGTS